MMQIPTCHREEVEDRRGDLVLLTRHDEIASPLRGSQ